MFTLLLLFLRLVTLYAFVLRTPDRPSFTLRAAVSSGDACLVIGGTGGVGQLVSNKLSKMGIHVRIASRSAEKAREALGDDKIDVVPVDLLAADSTARLAQALDGVQGLVISVGTTAFPTLKWKGGNTPDAVDREAVSKIAAVAAASGVERVVLVTSVGVERTDQMPFLILNLFGVLDAKKAGEDAVKVSASQGNFEYSIVRPGRLIGGPFTNEDVAKLLKIEGGAENGLNVAAGDDLLGDCKRDACAEAIVQCLTNTAPQNIEFSITSNDNEALTDEQWTQAFRFLQR